ncbi:MAG: YbaN family protein [Paraprevotella sp.]|nr:YbaN family protein [Paraprevotella sp.]
MKYVMIVLGSLALLLGLIGMFVPLLPTTPFLLLSAALYFRSSPRLYAWLLSRPRLGLYIRNFREYRAIPLRAKVVSVSLVWATLVYCAIVVSTVWWGRALFILLAVAISWHILSYKTLRK